MKRHSAYCDSSVNPSSANVQRMMQHYAAAMDNFPGRLHSLSVQEDPTYQSSKIEGQWQWDTDVSKLPNQMSSFPFNQQQGVYSTRSHYQGQALDSLESSANNENKAQPQEQDMEIGYEDSPSPLTFEGLERIFLDKVKKLVKEQSDEEDIEIARHKERIIEINTRYQEKLSALRAQQANRREEFLRKESETRLHQYQQAGLSSHPNSGLQDVRGYGGTAVAVSAGEIHGYRTGSFESQGDRSHFTGGRRTQGSEVRVPYPEGRVYNTSSQYY